MESYTPLVSGDGWACPAGKDWGCVAALLESCAVVSTGPESATSVVASGTAVPALLNRAVLASC